MTTIEPGGMDMQLHLNNENFRDLINLTSEYFHLASLIVEKDYWITHSLYQLSMSKYRDTVVFKGGTSLTKCYADLHRFSEDIDIALLAEGMSNSQIKTNLKGIEKIMKNGLEVVGFEDEIKSGTYRYTQFSYTSILSGELQELYPYVRFELTSFMHPHPHKKLPVSTFVEKYLIEKGMEDVVDELKLNKFELNVLAIERTVVEKIVSLVRMSYDSGLKELLAKTRHLYDLYMTYPMVKGFYGNSEEFTEMAALVKEAELESRFKDMYPYELKWKDAPLFVILDNPRIEQAYRENFGKEFVYGDLPDFEDVVDVMRKIHSMISKYDL